MSEDIGLELARLAVAGGIGAVAAVVAEPIKQWLVQRAFTPSISLHFFTKETLPYPSCHQDGTPNIDESTGQQKTTKNARIRISNDSTRRTAKNCRVYLHRIERFEARSGKYDLLQWENLPLPWAFSDYKPIDIPGGTSFYCDLFYLLSGSDEMFLRAHAPHYSWKSATDSNGSYRFTIMTVGDNFPPRTLTISFNWKGTYSSTVQEDFAVVSEGLS